MGIDEQVKNILNEKEINEALIENGISKLADVNELIVIHDGSDIRKEHASKLEKLGKVRDLKGKIINGYSTFNSIAVDLEGKRVIPLSSKVYSNRSDEFISQKELKIISKPLHKKANSEQAAKYEAIKEKVANVDYINTNIISRVEIKKISTELKKDKANRKLTHVIDRGSDDDGMFKYISEELGDEFVIRLKASRVGECDGEKCREKLANKEFPYKSTRHYSKIQIKSKVYQDVKVILEWGEQLNGYNVVRICMLSRDGKMIFKSPMLLITNKAVTNIDQALKIYHIYLKRSKIESVFKFLKEVLGWEDSQIRNFSAIKTLLTFCYFIAGYFYEIESSLIKNESIQFIANLGGGKGRVTREYILRGFARIITKVEVDQAIAESNITPEQIQEILLFANGKRAI
jgi:Transposase DDE domain